MRQMSRAIHARQVFIAKTFMLHADFYWRNIDGVDSKIFLKKTILVAALK
jgi:hypothetical protein